MIETNGKLDGRNMDKVRVATVPGSKSITNRALLLAVLSDREYLLQGAQFSDDSRYFLGALKSLGFSVQEDEVAKTVRIAGTNGRVPEKDAQIYVGSAGTAARFLTAMLAFSDGIYTITASEQMARRPMKPLFEALTSLGAEFHYLGEAGHLPVRVTGIFAGRNSGENLADEGTAKTNPAAGRKISEHFDRQSNADMTSTEGIKNGSSKPAVSIDISESTQYLSALLMTASMLPDDLKIHITSEKKQGSYIEITRRMMNEFGIRTEFDGENYIVKTPAHSLAATSGDIRYGSDRKFPQTNHADEISKFSQTNHADEISKFSQTDHADEIGKFSQTDHADEGSKLAKTDYTDEIRKISRTGRMDTEIVMYQIEPDVSAACYFYAAAMLTGGSVQVRHIHKDSMQGDMKFLALLEQLGAVVDDLPDGICVTAPVEENSDLNGNTVKPAGKFPGIEINMNDFSDQAITLAALAPFASSPVVISGIAHIRRQESDRLHGIAENLARMGIRAEEAEDSIKIWPGEPKPCEIETYDDHRMAMGFALVGFRVPGMTIKNPQCCQKTFQEYFEEMERVFGLRADSFGRINY